ncbi:MAG: hypothetical protein ACR2GD_13815 [Pyrinomonadaceae bacterium]
MPNLFKDIIVWRYERASWQWDVLCLLILAFIFFTPKTWFDHREKLATRTERLIVKADDFPLDKTILEQRVRELSGNENAEVLGWQKKNDADGQPIYEIDIR